jgi:EamA domain-containing membrane protein RarD
VRIAVLLFTSIVALFIFSQSPGAEAVRTVQVLLLFAAGMCAGVALTLFRMARAI